jgi:thioesterase domain-containing protein/aryl carrier-like protein
VVATSTVLKAGSHGTPSIGRPIRGTSVYLLNEDGQQVPDGTIGEIHIGGSGVGRGYRNLPESTERSFLPDPFVGIPGARMYRTGDRGLRRPDGEIEFRGRLDRQTKIRGQRVELDEIGSILSRHPSIAFAAGVTRNSQGEQKQLVAYVFPKENAPVPPAHELQEFLLRSLPDYMIPAAFARLDALPLSANGKIDLTMLPPLADAQLLGDVAAKAPVRLIAEKLLTMVRALLESDTVEAEDSFFLAGGHSLLGMQLVVRVRKEFGVDLTLRQLFENPTVERLALLLEAMLTGTVDSWSGEESETYTTFGQNISIPKPFQSSSVCHQAAITQEKAKAESALPPGVHTLQSHGSRNSIFWLDYVCVELAKAIGDGQPLVSVALTAQDFASLGEPPTLQNIAACALHKVMAAQPRGPYTLGGFCRGGILAYEIASQLRAAGHEVTLLVLLDAPNPSYIESCDSLRRKANYLRYALGRAARIGIRRSVVHFCDHLPRRLAPRVTKSANTEMRAVHEMMQAATLAYHPQAYEGKVLLLLASEHPPHVNFLPGWQAVVPHDLHTRYIEGHHRDLLQGRNVRAVADAIFSYLSTSGDRLSSRADVPGSTRSSAGNATT